jgi:hypothetical protein
MTGGSLMVLSRSLRETSGLDFSAKLFGLHHELAGLGSQGPLRARAGISSCNGTRSGSDNGSSCYPE